MSIGKIKINRNVVYSTIFITIVCLLYVGYDLSRRASMPKDNTVNMTKEEIVDKSWSILDSADSHTVNTFIDIYLKQTVGRVTYPYMLGQSLESKITDDVYSMSGGTVLQIKETKISRQYNAIDNGINNYRNASDIIWVKSPTIDNNIKDSYQLVGLVNDNIDNFTPDGYYYVDGIECYKLTGELLYADLLPHLINMTNDEESIDFLNQITRNGFYSFTDIYINKTTLEPVRVHIDFIEQVIAFAGVDGADEGYSVAASTFFFQLNFSDINNTNLVIDDDIILNSVDEYELWKMIISGEITIDELSVWIAILGYNESDFYRMVSHFELSESEKSRIYNMFNFDDYGNPIIPNLTLEQFNNLNMSLPSGFTYDNYIDSYNGYILNSYTTGSNYEYYKAIYNLLCQNSTYNQTFESFLNDINKQGYDSFIAQYNLSVHIDAYDSPLGVVAEYNSGVNMNGELSDNWYSYSFKYKNTVIGLPVSLSELIVATGYNINSADDTSISPGSTKNITLKNGNSMFTVMVKNKSDSKQSVTNCSVQSLTLSSNLSTAEQNNFTLPAGFKIGSSYSSIISGYGNPYSGENTDNLTYLSSLRNETMKLTFTNNSLSKITFQL